MFTISRCSLPSDLKEHSIDDIIIFHIQFVRSLAVSQPRKQNFSSLLRLQAQPKMLFQNCTARKMNISKPLTVEEKTDLVELKALPLAIRLHQLLQRCLQIMMITNTNLRK